MTKDEKEEKEKADELRIEESVSKMLKYLMDDDLNDCERVMLSVQEAVNVATPEISEMDGSLTSVNNMIALIEYVNGMMLTQSMDTLKRMIVRNNYISLFLKSKGYTRDDVQAFIKEVHIAEQELQDETLQ